MTGLFREAQISKVNPMVDFKNGIYIETSVMVEFTLEIVLKKVIIICEKGERNRKNERLISEGVNPKHM